MTDLEGFSHETVEVLTPSSKEGISILRIQYVDVIHIHQMKSYLGQTHKMTRRAGWYEIVLFGCTRYISKSPVVQRFLSRETTILSTKLRQLNLEKMSCKSI
jgi:hypothetical protein